MENDQVAQVKSKVDIVEIIGERISLLKAGKNFKAPCPFHSERTPSFVVSPEIQFYKCFGCGEHGDVFTFLEKYEGMEFFEALKYLAERVGVKLKLSSGRERGLKERIYEINNLTSAFYSYVLFQHPKGKNALKYLLEVRGLKNSTIKSFNLGYCPDEPFALRGYFAKRKITDDEAIKTGVIYKSDRYVVDRFRGRVIFPLYDHRGNIAGFAGRSMPGTDTSRAKYINTPETAVYLKSKLLYGLNVSKSEIKKKDYAVIVEGELDMISSWQAGVKNTVAIKGSALTLEQIKLLSRYTKKIILALDSDFAGNSAARRGIEIADKEGLEIKVARLDPYKDPDDAARKDLEFYKKTLREAVPIWNFLIDSVFSKFAKLGGIETARISKELAPVLSSITDKIVQAHYVEIVAKKLGVVADAVYNQLKNSRNIEESKTEEVFKAKTSRMDLLEDRLVSLLLANEPGLLLGEEYSSLIKKPLHKKIKDYIRDYQISNPIIELPELANSLPAELQLGFSELVIKGNLSNESSYNYTKELEIIMHEIALIQTKQKLKEITDKIAFETDPDNLQELNKKFGELTKKLSELEENNHKGIILVNQ